MRLTRLNQLWVLIFLTAFSTCIQYALQGALATDAEIAAFPKLLWTADYVAWAGRALIEAWVLAYVFTTIYHTNAHRILITFVEIVLLTLIAVTLGPTFYAIGSGQKMYEALSAEGFWFWNFGIASYPSIMMAATGIAYRIMPEDRVARVDEDIGRQQAIAKMLRLADPKTIEWLAEHFKVSESTIITDIAALGESVETAKGGKVQLVDF